MPLAVTLYFHLIRTLYVLFNLTPKKRQKSLTIEQYYGYNRIHNYRQDKNYHILRAIIIHTFISYWSCP